MSKVFNGRYLGALCKREGLLQKDLAEKIGISGVTVSSMVNGKTKNPAQDNVSKLAEYFKVEPESFWTEGRTTTTTKPKKKPAPAKEVINPGTRPRTEHVTSKSLTTELIPDSFPNQVMKTSASKDESPVLHRTLVIIGELYDGAYIAEDTSGAMFRVTKM